MKLGELAARLECKLEGGENSEVHGVARIESAKPGEVTFLSNPKYSGELAKTLASAVFVDEKAAIKRAPGLPPLAALRSKNPYFDFARAIELFSPPTPYPPGIHPTAVVAKSATIGGGAHIGPHCFVDEGVQIGRNAVLHSLVTIYRNTRIGDDFLAHSQSVVREGCTIGNRVILQNGVVIGGDGFGFAKRPDGRWHKIMQLRLWSSRTTSKYRPIPVSIGPPSEKRVSAAAQRSTTSCWSGMPAKWVRTPFCAGKWDWQDRRASETAASWRGKSARLATSKSAKARPSHRKAEFLPTFPPGRCIRVIPPWKINCG